jgi:hypothetical protein
LSASPFGFFGTGFVTSPPPPAGVNSVVAAWSLRGYRVGMSGTKRASKRKVKARQIAIDGDHMAVVTEDGEAIHRKEHMPIGKWGDVELPDKRAPKRQRSRRKRKAR